jgi:hypothetical protein
MGKKGAYAKGGKGASGPGKGQPGGVAIVGPDGRCAMAGPGEVVFSGFEDVTFEVSEIMVGDIVLTNNLGKVREIVNGIAEVRSMNGMSQAFISATAPQGTKTYTVIRFIGGGGGVDSGFPGGSGGGGGIADAPAYHEYPENGDLSRLGGEHQISIVRGDYRAAKCFIRKWSLLLVLTGLAFMAGILLKEVLK